jgi:hypothetical protein
MTKVEHSTNGQRSGQMIGAWISFGERTESLSERKRGKVNSIVGNSSWRDKAAIGLLETRTVGEHNVRVYADRLAIWRKDGRRLAWEELQAVKQSVWGDRVAVEVYPAQGDVVNLRHTRHLWTGPLLTAAVAAECTHCEFANNRISR